MNLSPQYDNMLPYVFHTRKKTRPEKERTISTWWMCIRRKKEGEGERQEKNMHIVQQRPHRSNMRIQSLLIVPVIYFAIGMYQQWNWYCALYVFTIDVRQIYLVFFNL